VVVLVLTAYSVYKTNQIGTEVAESIVEDQVKGDLYALEYRLKQEYGAISYKNGTLVTVNNGVLDDDFAVIDEFSKSMGVVATIFVKDGDDFRRLITNIIDKQGKRAVGTMLGKKSAAYAPVKSGKTYLGRAVILGEKYITIYAPIFAQDGRDIIGINFAGVKTEKIKSTVSMRCAASARTMILLSVIMLAASIALTTFIFRKIIVKPVKKIMTAMTELSKGNLTVQTDIKNRDEIGNMATSFNETIVNLRTMVVDIRKQAAGLSTIGNDLSSNMDNTASAMNEITANIDSIKERTVNQSASVTQTSATMEQITGNLQKLSDSINIQSDSVSQASSAIEEMLANIKSVTDTLMKNADNVNSLSEASDVGHSGLQAIASEIGEISKESAGLLEINAVMENIASQTNLLSMNAAIEAAHAGEAGKGFAVVADEIRKLAENSSEQSKTISTVLKKITESIRTITASTEDVLSKFESITSGVKIVADQEGNIRNAMEQQMEGSKQVLDGVARVNEITTSVKSSAAEMREGSQQIITESKNLEGATEEISGGMHEMAIGVDQVNKSVNQINDESTKNKESIDALINEVQRFKVAADNEKAA
jgi:methyl-accepting chemotaxis protein